MKGGMTLMQNDVRIVRPSQGMCAIYVTSVTCKMISMQEKLHFETM